MKLLIIRNAEANQSTSTNEILSKTGVQQAVATSNWFLENFSLKDYVGFSSPYTRSLQTASIIQHLNEIEIFVDDRLREHHGSGLPIKGDKFKDKRDIFSNLNWKKANAEIVCKNESINDSVDRIRDFYSSLKKVEKAVIITEAKTARMLIDMATGSGPELLKQKYEANHNLLNEFLPPKIETSSVTLIEDNLIKWEPKRVYIKQYGYRN